MPPLHRLILLHKQSTSGRVRFFCLSSGVVAFSPLPELSALRDEDYSPTIQFHPTAVVREAEIHLGLPEGAIEPVADRLFIDDGDRLTCAGGAAAADLAAYLVERHLGKAWAMKSLNIMLLDEATSTLDPATETVILSASERVTRGRTSVIVAHRLATAQRADRIIVISGGRIIEDGSHDELLAAEGTYSGMWHLVR